MVKGSDAKTQAVPDIVYAQAIVTKDTSRSMFEDASKVTNDNISNFYPKQETLYSAAHKLTTEGFNVLRVDALFINFAGPASLFEQVFKTTIVTKELPVIKESRKKDTATFLDSSDTDILGHIDPSKSPMEKELDAVALEVKRYSFSGIANPFPPTVPYWHLDIPDDVSSGMNASLVAIVLVSQDVVSESLW